MSTKEEIMDYVLHTPENVNPAILSDKLDQYSSGGSGIQTATVTLINADEGVVDCVMPYIFDGHYMARANFSDDVSGQTYIVPIGEAGTNLDLIAPGANLTVSGDISIISLPNWGVIGALILGDGTITYSAS